jgi:GNAT superfamily N-acetyltransferase
MSSKRRRWRFFPTRWRILTKPDGPVIQLSAPSASSFVTRAIVAGLSGETYCGWLVIKYLWVRDDLRRRGIGRRLIAQAEASAAVTRLGLIPSASRRVGSMRGWVIRNSVGLITRQFISGIS